MFCLLWNFIWLFTGVVKRWWLNFHFRVNWSFKECSKLVTPFWTLNSAVRIKCISEEKDFQWKDLVFLLKKDILRNSSCASFCFFLSAATTAASASTAWTGFAASAPLDSPDRTAASVSPWEPEGACGGVRWAGGQRWKAAAGEREPIVSGRQIRKPFRKTVLTSPLCAEPRSAQRCVRRVSALSRGLLGEISSEKPFQEQSVIQLKRFEPSSYRTIVWIPSVIEDTWI